jgi:hypothetical protein
LNTHHNSNQPSNNPGDKPSVHQALERLVGFAHTLKADSMEQAFIEALQGKEVREIDRYQVYTDYSETETVVFIHEPTGRSEHKYIFAVTNGHTYMVAAPTEWTGFHWEILARVSATSEVEATCPGAGYIHVSSEGSLVVDRCSDQFGEGDHERAKSAFEAAVRRTSERAGIN